MLSDRPGTPGRRQQMPRTIRSIVHAGLRGGVERVDHLGVDQAVHLEHDAARPAAAADLALDQRRRCRAAASWGATSSLRYSTSRP